VLGVAGIVVMGVSVMMIKERLNDLPVLWSTWVRLAAGTLGILPLIAISRDRRRLLEALRPSRSWRWAVPASFAGTYLAMVFWLGGMKFTDVSRAALLNQLSTIFIFVLATLILREPLNARRVVAIALALAGALLVLW
jgi:drug/metabolite transporter (DMT)-like permease